MLQERFQKKILKKTLKGRAFVGVSENERIEVNVSCPHIKFLKAQPSWAVWKSQRLKRALKTESWSLQKKKLKSRAFAGISASGDSQNEANIE